MSVGLLTMFGVLVFVVLYGRMNEPSPSPPPSQAAPAPRDPALLKQDTDQIVQRFAENSKADKDDKVAQARACVQAARAKGEDVAKAANRCANAANQPKAPPPGPVDPKVRKERTFQTVVVAMKLVKAHLREPESAVWEAVFANDDATVICMQYRARNGFGGMAREQMIIDKTGASQAASAWNRKCAGKPLTDYLYATYAL